MVARYNTKKHTVHTKTAWYSWSYIALTKLRATRNSWRFRRLLASLAVVYYYGLIII